MVKLEELKADAMDRLDAALSAADAAYAAADDAYDAAWVAAWATYQEELKKIQEENSDDH
jgi:hypothetical protein